MKITFNNNNNKLINPPIPSHPDKQRFLFLWWSIVVGPSTALEQSVGVPSAVAGWNSVDGAERDGMPGWEIDWGGEVLYLKQQNQAR
jgi:hypothetical protein